MNKYFESALIWAGLAYIMVLTSYYIGFLGMTTAILGLIIMLVFMYYHALKEAIPRLGLNNYTKKIEYLLIIGVLIISFDFLFMSVMQGPISSMPVSHIGLLPLAAVPFLVK